MLDLIKKNFSFPQRIRYGLIEVSDPQRATRARHHGFRSGFAAASLKSFRYGRAGVFGTLFPQRIRCGLIEVASESTIGDIGNIGFRSGFAAASLKCVVFLQNSQRILLFPQRIRCGLIEGS